MNSNEIIIKYDENGKTEVNMKNKIDLPELIQVLLSLCLEAMTKVAKEAPELKEDIYDKFNYGASTVLSLFAPELELRPNLTAQAILEAENKIINEGRAPKLVPDIEAWRREK